MLTRIYSLLSQSRTVQFARDLPLRLNPPESYSQHGEDRFLLDEVFAGKTIGRYVDIGASHPARLSNTYLMYRAGWSGLVVEPISALLSLQRQWRPNDIQVQSLIGETDGAAEFYQLFPSVLSTTSIQDRDEQVAKGSILLRSQTIPQLTLQTLLTKYLGDAQIDFISVDVEGIDIEIAQQISRLKQTPFAVCIEANSDSAEVELRRILEPCYSNSKHIACNLIFWQPAGLHSEETSAT